MNLPWEILDACNGFSIDIGGSNMKFVYIDKNDWKEPEKREQGSMGRLSFKNFPHNNMEAPGAFEFLHKNVHRRKTSDSPVIYGTGFGSSVLSAKFMEEFGVKIQCEDEFTCFSSALVYLIKNVPRGDILQTPDAKEEESFFDEGKIAYGSNVGIRRKITVENPDRKEVTPDDLIAHQKSVRSDLDKPLSQVPDMFPCVLLICGSGFGSFLVQEDGSCEIINTTPFAGKFWLGMGNFLTDAQNYEELMALVEKGNHANVDYLMADASAGVTEENKNDDMYQNLLANSKKADTRSIFTFAKVTQQNKGDLKQEDLAKSMLMATMYNMAFMGVTAARLTGVRHVFFSGGFMSHPLVQKIMNHEWIMTMCQSIGLADRIDPIAVHFLQQSSHLGALGALLKN